MIRFVRQTGSAVPVSCDVNRRRNAAGATGFMLANYYYKYTAENISSLWKITDVRASLSIYFSG